MLISHTYAFLKRRWSERWKRSRGTAKQENGRVSQSVYVSASGVPQSCKHQHHSVNMYQLQTLHISRYWSRSFSPSSLASGTPPCEIITTAEVTADTAHLQDRPTDKQLGYNAASTPHIDGCSVVRIAQQKLWSAIPSLSSVTFTCRTKHAEWAYRADSRGVLSLCRGAAR